MHRDLACPWVAIQCAARFNSPGRHDADRHDQTAGLLFACALGAAPAFAQSGTFQVKQMTPEAAAKAARAALEECRKRGYQVAVAVVDRAGVAQALIRDRFAGPHTVETAINKG